MRIIKPRKRKIAKRGFCGIGVYQPKTSENIGTLWREAFLFGADFIFTIGRRYKHQCSDTMKVPNHIPLWEFLTFADFIEAMPKNAKKVFVELTENATLLPEYIHPERAVYILGSEDNGVPLNLINKFDDLIKIPQSSEICSSNVAVTGSLVLYDRFIKLNA